MRTAFLFMILPALASCVFVPEEAILSKGIHEMHTPARSYAIQPPPPDRIFAGTETVYRNNYVLNETVSIKVGDILLREQAFRKDKTILSKMTLDRDVVFKVGTEEIKLPAKQYKIYGTFELNGEKYYVLPKVGHYYFLADMNGFLQTRYLYDIKNSKRVTIFPDKASFSPVSAKLKRATREQTATLPFSDFEVIYDGVKNNQIVLFYKDSVPGTNGGKGSFDTLSFPADATMISVAGRLIRVIRADREQITYIVVKE